MRGIGKASRRPRRFARATEGGFPRLSARSAWRGGVGHRKPRATPPESLGKPSLRVIISAPWYYVSNHEAGSHVIRSRPPTKESYAP